MVGHADSARRTVYVDVALIRSKVKVKVTEHLNFRQLPIMHMSTAGFAWSSKLMVDGHSMGSGLQLVGARFLGHRLGDDLVDWN